MLRLSVLTPLMMLGQVLVTARPLRTPRVAPQPQSGPSDADLQFAEDYLRHFYGFQPESLRQRRAAEAEDDANWNNGLCDKVRRMQRFFGLPPSGELTNETLVAMRRPRCGLSDAERFRDTMRWKRNTLSYRIAGRKPPITGLKVRKLFRAAWKIWSNVALMKLRKRNRREADIVISFNSGDHWDGSPFDGKGGVLAHAFLPGSGIGGDVHFDAEEDWSLNSTGFNLLVVAVHEFGHALGLPHSSDPGAVMYPAYNFAPHYELQLSFRDVKDIQQLYGTSPSFASLVLKKPPPRTPDKCDPDLSFDAVTELQQELLFFKDRFMWRKHPQFDETGITLISSLWPDVVPSHLDAAYENVEKYVNLFFKGEQYWLLRQLILEEGYPRNISAFGFPSRIKAVDAALHFREERSTVFFTGHECWRYDELLERMEGSPMLIEEEWPGVPTPIDAAVSYQGFVHFFKENLHYKYNRDLKSVVSTSPANSLLDCKEEEEEQEKEEEKEKEEKEEKEKEKEEEGNETVLKTKVS